MVDGFVVSLGWVFLAELGDKTQLVALCLASRFAVRTVLSGILVATLAVHLLSVALGGGLGRLIPDDWINLGAGLAFIGFGFWSLRGDTLSEDECGAMQGSSPFWLVTTTFFLAELGDKTMLATVTMATQYAAVGVWIGSSLGMVVSDGLAIAVGQLLGRRLPERAVKVGAAVMFFAFGAYSAALGAVSLPPYSWAIAALVVAAFAGLFRLSKRRRYQLPAIIPDRARARRRRRPQVAPPGSTPAPTDLFDAPAP